MKIRVAKTIAWITAAFALVVGLAGCAPQEPRDVPRVGLILCNPRGDNSVADSMYEGVLRAQEIIGFEFDYSECVNATEPEYFLEEYARAGTYDLIIVETFTFYDALMKVAPRYPGQKFLYWDNAGTQLQNVMSGRFAQEEASFLSGVFAALVDAKGGITIQSKAYHWEPKGVVGLIGGVESPDTIRYLAAFIAGAKYINPDVNVIYASAGTWDDQVRCKELARSMYEEGAAIVSPYLGAGIYGVVEAAKDMGRLCIGFSRASNNEISPHIAGTSASDTQTAVMKALVTIFQEDGFEGAATLNYSYATGDQDFIYQEGLELPEDVALAMERVKAQVSAGEIPIPMTFEEARAFDAVYQEAGL